MSNVTVIVTSSTAGHHFRPAFRPRHGKPGTGWLSGGQAVDSPQYFGGCEPSRFHAPSAALTLRLTPNGCGHRGDRVPAPTATNGLLPALSGRYPWCRLASTGGRSQLARFGDKPTDVERGATDDRSAADHALRSSDRARCQLPPTGDRVLIRHRRKCVSFGMLARYSSRCTTVVDRSGRYLCIGRSQPSGIRAAARRPAP